jgi:site-specific DNA-methyltransferase (adenine-specific)
MAVRIEDAGFEIRDQIMWIYGSGFPKSLNIGKAVDKLQGNERAVVETYIKKSGDFNGNGIGRGNYDDIELQKTKGNSLYEGWGTALKPAHEPIVMARKPLLEKTVVDNVLEWGTGGINIDASRIGTEQRTYKGMSSNKPEGAGTFRDDNSIPKDIENTVQGRFPANIIFDEEAGKILDEQSGISKSTGGRIEKKTGWGEFGGNGNKEIIDGQPGFGDVGGASRFFYCPKTSKTDRNEGLDGFEEKKQDLSRKEGKVGGDNPRNRGVNKRKNHHPTVKPTDLMLYLIRLVTPKNATTLDPFMGSGSTGKAAVRGGFDFIGIEREEEYMRIAESRIQYEIECTNKKNKYKQIDLFEMR